MFFNNFFKDTRIEYNVNRPITIEDIEKVIKELFLKIVLGPDGFTDTFFQILKVQVILMQFKFS